MFDNTRKSKIKSDNLFRSRTELSQFKFNILYRPGTENTFADTFSRISALTYTLQDLRDLHLQFYQSGIIRLSHFTTARTPYHSIQTTCKVYPTPVNSANIRKQNS